MDSFLENIQNINLPLLQNVIDGVVFDNDIGSMGTLNDYAKGNADPTHVYGCKHYLRRCKIVAPCCDNIYSCRLCHDENEFDKVMNVKLQHRIDRFKIKEVICNACDVKQSVKQCCENCGICFGLYYCDICHLFDDIDKEQYHCHKCGICRVGKNNSIHCDKCGICVNLNNLNHKCINIVDSLCPICMEDLFKSINGISQMKCGHYIHRKCFYEMLESTYKCPTCSCSIVDTDGINEFLDNEIALTPMPEDLKDLVITILCNDCHHETNTKFHIVALKCGHCGGFNTRKI